MAINLHIERLVLDGIDIAPGQSKALQENVVSQLTQLLGSRGLASSLSAGAAVKQVSTNSIHLDNAQPANMGSKIAQSVYGGIGRE